MCERSHGKGGVAMTSRRGPSAVTWSSLRPWTDSGYVVRSNTSQPGQGRCVGSGPREQGDEPTLSTWTFGSQTTSCRSWRWSTAEVWQFIERSGWRPDRVFAVGEGTRRRNSR